VSRPSNARVREYWDVHIHDLDISSHPPGSPEFFRDLDDYHFEKLHHLLRLVDFAAYAGMAIAWPGGMGMGDVKLAGVLGAFLGFAGWAALAVGAFAAFVLGGVVSILLLVTKRVSRKGGIPFGPWMIAGAWVGLVLGASIAALYLSLFGIELS